jgi:DIM1 family U5 snRNP protein
MYELYDNCTLMFFYRYVVDLRSGEGGEATTDTRRNKHIMIDLGTGNNNKMSVAYLGAVRCALMVAEIGQCRTSKK